VEHGRIRRLQLHGTGLNWSDRLYEAPAAIIITGSTHCYCPRVAAATPALLLLLLLSHLGYPLPGGEHALFSPTTTVAASTTSPDLSTFLLHFSPFLPISPHFSYTT